MWTLDARARQFLFLLGNETGASWEMSLEREEQAASDASEEVGAVSKEDGAASQEVGL